MQNKNISYILMDIEGTISDTAFVKEILFPYAKAGLKTFFEQNQQCPSLRLQLEKLWDRVPDDLLAASLQKLHALIDDDVKHPVLKDIQGMIWKRGFEQGDFKSPMYQDVLPQWKYWKGLGLTLGIYSSGSAMAQKLFFQYSQYGDLRPYLDHFFDLSVGRKKDPSSYEKIAKTISQPPECVFFLSDAESELKAAQQAGFQVSAVLRPGALEASEFPSVRRLDELPLSTSA